MAASDSRVPNLYADALPGNQVRRWLLSRESFRQAMMVFEQVADFLTCSTATICAYFLQLVYGSHVQCPFRQVVAVGILEGIFAVLLLQRKGALGGDVNLLRIRETERAIETSVQTFLLLLLTTFLLRLSFPPGATFIALGLTTLLLIAQKQIFSSILDVLYARGYGVDRVAVYGAGEAGKQIVSTLLYSPRLGLRPVGLVGDGSLFAGDSMSEKGYRRCDSIPVEAGPLTPSLLQSLKCNLLLVAMTTERSEDLTRIMHITKQAGTSVALMLRSLPLDRSGRPPIEIDGWQLSAPSERMSRWRYLFAKRFADIVVSSLLLILLAPILLLIGLMIRFSSPGPAIFVQKRAGEDGQLFDMYKFRSMWTGTPRYEVSPTVSADPRITRLGRFLRRTSLDELPQLINVFLGDMTLVGPRPEMPFIVESYSEQHRRRLQVVPGITGLWQLSADRALPIHENMEYDLYYIRNRTFFMDVAILLHTLLFAVGNGV